MAVSRVTLANAALAKLTRDRITDLDGKEPGAVQMSIHMDAAIEEVIEEYDWPECRVIVSPSAALGIDSGEYTYAYPIPSDCVVIHLVYEASNPRKPVPYEMGMDPDVTKTDSYIFTSTAAPRLRYGSRRCPLHRFTPLVIDLMATKLAEKTCLTLGQDKKYKLGLKDQFVKDLNHVKTLVANREPELYDNEFVPETITVRSA